MQGVAAPRPFCAGGHGNTELSNHHVCRSLRPQRAPVIRPTPSSSYSSSSSTASTTLQERTTIRIFATYKAAQAHSDANNVKVKFVLHRACQFGHQFNVVGDDLLLGSWNPQAAAPMKWSEGHIWTTELEFPVGKRIEFKFILIGNRGHIEWQPGANCIFETSSKFPSLLVERSWEEFEDQTAEVPTINDHHTVEASVLESFKDSDETPTEITAESITAAIVEGAQGASAQDFIERNVSDIPLPSTTPNSTAAEQSFPSLLAARSWEEFEDTPTAEEQTGSKDHIQEASMVESLEKSDETSPEVTVESTIGAIGEGAIGASALDFKEEGILDVSSQNKTFNSTLPKTSGDSGTGRNDANVSTIKRLAGGKKTSLFESFVRSLPGFGLFASICQP